MHGRLGDVLAVRPRRRPAWRRRRRRARAARAARPGAVWWEMPTTRTLMPAHPSLTRSGRLALLVVGEDLQLDGQVDLAYVDALGHASTVGAKLRMLVMPAATIRSATSWAATRRGGDDADRDAVLADDLLEVVEGAHVEPGDQLVVPVGVGVEQRDDPEAADAEAGVVGERVAEVADADDDDRPVLGHADLAGDLVAQVVDVVADAAGAVGAEVGEVLAQLGAVDAGRGGELLAGAGARCRARRAR